MFIISDVFIIFLCIGVGGSEHPAAFILLARSSTLIAILSIFSCILFEHLHCAAWSKNVFVRMVQGVVDFLHPDP
jgi:hypothetical protein